MYISVKAAQTNTQKKWTDGESYTFNITIKNHVKQKQKKEKKRPLNCLWTLTFEKIDNILCKSISKLLIFFWRKKPNRKVTRSPKSQGTTRPTTLYQSFDLWSKQRQLGDDLGTILGHNLETPCFHEFFGFGNIISDIFLGFGDIIWWFRVFVSYVSPNFCWSSNLETTFFSLRAIHDWWGM